MVVALLDESDLSLSDDIIETIVDKVSEILSHPHMVYAFVSSKNLKSNNLFFLSILCTIRLLLKQIQKVMGR